MALGKHSYKTTCQIDTASSTAEKYILGLNEMSRKRFLQNALVSNMYISSRWTMSG